MACLAVDVVLLCVAMLLAYWLWIRLATPAYPGIRLYAGHLVAGVITLAIMLAKYRLYDAKYLLSYRQMVRIIVKTGIVWLAACLAFALVLKFDPPISPLHCLLSGVVAVNVLLAWRWVLHRVLRREKYASLLRRRIVFIGWNEHCEAAMNRYLRGRGNSIAFTGVVTTPTDGLSQTSPQSEVRVLGDFDAAERILKHHDVDTVFVADLDLSQKSLVALANFCENEMIEFKLVPSCFEVLISGLHLETVCGMPLLGVSKLPLNSPFNNYIKRAVDIVGGLVGLVLSAPLIVIFGTLTYLESPGPVFYKQRRLGRDGKTFNIIKLRSMAVNAERAGQVGWTVKGDPRVLRIGKFMRSWNIDEIPQFWNVLRGEMSLVGPRPERPELIETFKEEIPHYNARHHTKPGITGWAQVNGLRGDTDLSERLHFDLHYIERWNLLFDLKILLLTFMARDNAY